MGEGQSVMREDVVHQPRARHGGVRKGRKFAQVMEGARAVFLADGFEGASVDDIAKASNVSKATLYNYFLDKRLLFLEVARHECARTEDSHLEFPDGRAVEEVLKLSARHIVSRMQGDIVLKAYRTCVAETERFPEIGTEFYQSGHVMERDRLVVYLGQAVARGELEIAQEDLQFAAEQWLALCRADVVPRLIFDVEAQITEAEIDRVAEGAVAMFLARYGVKAA